MKNSPTDKYDDAIAYLTNHSHEIQEAWLSTNSHIAGCLFNFATQTGYYKAGCGCGCLTSIRRTEYNSAATPELTKAIRADERIPKRFTDIKLSDLPVFAEWQRRIDIELKRKA
jgi:hypothetical protein